MASILRGSLASASAATASRLTGVSPAVGRAFVLAPCSRQPPFGLVDAPPSDGAAVVVPVGRRIGTSRRDPTLDLSLPPRSGWRPARLTDDEIALCRSHAAVALTITAGRGVGARRGDVSHDRGRPGHVRGDIDLDEGAVWIHGGDDRDRWGHLTDWGSFSSSGAWCGTGATPSSRSSTSGDGSAASRPDLLLHRGQRVLVRAGLGDEPDVRPASVAAWAGRQILDETGGSMRSPGASACRASTARPVHRLGLGRRERRVRTSARGVSALERLEALVANPTSCTRSPTPSRRPTLPGGRPRQYPAYMWLLFDALLSRLRLRPPGRSRARPPARVGPPPSLDPRAVPR